MRRFPRRPTILANLCQRGWPVDAPTMNISLPESLKAFVEEQVALLGYAPASECFCDVLRAERDRPHLRELLLEGARSGKGAPPHAGINH